MACAIFAGRLVLGHPRHERINGLVVPAPHLEVFDDRRISAFDEGFGSEGQDIVLREGVGFFALKT